MIKLKDIIKSILSEGLFLTNIETAESVNYMNRIIIPKSIEFWNSCVVYNNSEYILNEMDVRKNIKKVKHFISSRKDISDIIAYEYYNQSVLITIVIEKILYTYGTSNEEITFSISIHDKDNIYYLNRDLEFNKPINWSLRNPQRLN